VINSKPNLITILSVAPLLGAILQAIISNFTGIDYGHLMVVLTPHDTMKELAWALTFQS
jgi:hypothetical protein